MGRAEGTPTRDATLRAQTKHTKGETQVSGRIAKEPHGGGHPVHDSLSAHSVLTDTRNEVHLGERAAPKGGRAQGRGSSVLHFTPLCWRIRTLPGVPTEGSAGAGHMENTRRTSISTRIRCSDPTVWLFGKEDGVGNTRERRYCS